VRVNAYLVRWDTTTLQLTHVRNVLWVPIRSTRHVQIVRHRVPPATRTHIARAVIRDIISIWTHAQTTRRCVTVMDIMYLDQYVMPVCNHVQIAIQLQLIVLVVYRGISSSGLTNVSFSVLRVITEAIAVVWPVHQNVLPALPLLFTVWPVQAITTCWCHLQGVWLTVHLVLSLQDQPVHFASIHVIPALLKPYACRVSLVCSLALLAILLVYPGTMRPTIPVYSVPHLAPNARSRLQIAHNVSPTIGSSQALAYRPVRLRISPNPNQHNVFNVLGYVSNALVT